MLLVVVAAWHFLRPAKRDLRALYVDRLIHRAAKADTNAVAQLRRFGSDDLPALCRIITTPKPLAWELRLNAWLGNVPVQLRGLFPDTALPEAKATQARLVVTAMEDWGPHFATVVRAEASAPTTDSRANYGGVMYKASRRTIEDPARHSDPETIAAFVAGLTNGHPWNRVHCVFALAAIGPTASNAAPALRLRLKDGSRTLAQHAAEALWRITGDRREALETLLASVGSRDNEVQKAIRLDLGHIAPRVVAGCPSCAALIADNLAVHRPTIAVPPYGGPGGPMAWAYLSLLESDADLDVAAAAKAARARMRAEALRQGVPVPE